MSCFETKNCFDAPQRLVAAAKHKADVSQCLAAPQRCLLTRAICRRLGSAEAAVVSLTAAPRIASNYSTGVGSRDIIKHAFSFHYAPAISPFCADGAGNQPVSR